MSILTSVRAKAARWLRDSRILPFRVRRIIQRHDPPYAIPMDVYSTADEVVVLVSVAGLRPTDIEISLVDNKLSIEGGFASPVTNVNYALHERKLGRFSRKLALSVSVDADKTIATIRDGLLTVVLPKTLDSQSEVVRIPIEA